ncbi:MAG: PLU-1-like domain protein [Spirochaetota bacterium]
MADNFPELESYFQQLTDITDNVALINTPYGGDHDFDFQQMEDFYQDIISKEWEDTDKEYYNLFTSHYTFHVKIIEEIVKEAREILDPEKRPYLKKLVSYSKEANEWFLMLRKKRKQALANQAA